MNRDELIARIATAKEELEHAGALHRRDLTKYIRRMERELRDYDRFQREAQMSKNSA